MSHIRRTLLNIEHLVIVIDTTNEEFDEKDNINEEDEARN